MVQCAQNASFRLNGLESNTSNMYSGKDWEFAGLFSGSGRNDGKTVLASIALSKKLDEHYFFARFTPGYTQEFIFNSGIQIILKDPVRVETQLQKKIHYSEELGLGYSYRFNPSFSAGLSLRYFKQNFSEDVPTPVITDTVNFIQITNEVTNSNFWRGDLGFSYMPTEWLSLSLSSFNLLIAEENPVSSDSELYSMKKRKGFIASVRGNLFEKSAAFFSVESDGNFTSGFNYSFPFSNSGITIGVVAFHDKNQSPYITGILPSLNYSTKLFSVTVGALKYFENRNITRTVSDFTSSGIENLLNNKFSTDQIFAGVNFALSFIHNQIAKIEDVYITKEIFPALSEKYSDEPIATATVINLSDKLITIRPACLISGLNKEKVYSPYVVIEPGRKGTIQFFTLIDEFSSEIKRREIKQADFFIEVDNEIEDEIKKPILINDINAWDGNVTNLKYFVIRDLKYSSQLAKDYLAKNSPKIRSTSVDLEDFEKIKLLFNSIFSNLLYVADRRASAEVVQFPSETIKLKGGDCDDLSVCFSSLLESIGIETAFVDYQNDDAVYHVNLLVNTGLRPDQLGLITKNDKKVVVRKNEKGLDEIWIPIETTALKDFDSAWSIGSQKFQTEAVDQFGLANNKVHIIDIK